ncbi:ABC transporter permease [Paenibacillus apiarius]|uniref:Transport permease protein n=1 Tax=Paenibacillus apiarius TaxID=46240 RepID=A0ABT4DSF1_9BACL|nr:ABC transporter permease [Paenibacillus apiarius]MCY9514121.1 ABC transporter permease [Paenibacillus apiarius]MCY9520244.1 ABC transporter permease [Paenibacillus apiarius]MCY9550414.1 ABC transporter permease [Paenibacillus apiarius]MCY9557476.1 ABC transporter permease [Paenibacillus apiarius]MCY9682345.1 ABC transporter permease [Paenibacillus apiarius]
MKAKINLKSFVSTKDMTLKLAKNDFWTKYASSQLGIIWAFIQPIITILVYWFVFEIGFRVVPLNNVPYLLWLMCGLIPWFYFSEALLGSTNSLIEYSYLVKKVIFNIGILPAVKILSSLFVHVFFVIFLMYVFFLYGYNPNIYTVQIIYYQGCLIILTLGLAYLTSSIVVFFRDLNQIIMIILQFGVWLTPIMWNTNMFPDRFQWILKLNPIFYIVEGYRDSLFNEVWFWEKPNQSIYFWGLTLLIICIGVYFFKKLKPHYSDVL